MSDPRSVPPSSRREFLATGASLSGLGMAVLLGGNACAEPRPQPAFGQGATDADLLDRALVRVHACLPTTGVHFSNHVPMVVETLSTLGRAAAIAPWLDENFTPRDPDAPAAQRIDAARWRELVGKLELFTDWRAFFIAELAADDWRAVLRFWVPRFAPGLAGAATHGVIRSGHAARALAARDNEIRRRELATGLAYWAGNYEELPWDGSLTPETSVAAAFARVVPRQPALAPPQGNIVTGLRALQTTPSFQPVAGLVDTRDPARTLGELTSACARLYLANPASRIAFTHSITAPSALRLLAPHLDDETVEKATRYAWQASAGIFVVYGNPERSAPAASAARSREELVDSAVASGGTHAIKLTEACLREEALSHDAALLQAAADAGESMNG